MKLTEHQGRYLKAVDVIKPKLLTIRDATTEQLDDGTYKDIIWFNEVEQGLMLNKTNCLSIIEITGTDDSDQMIGQKIVLYKTKTDFGGKSVDCIRVRAPKYKNEPPPNVVEEEPDDDIPF